jgi:hypothetical protein
VIGTYTPAVGVLTRPHIQPADLIKLTGVDLWGVMIAKAESAEREEPLGIRYLCAGAAGPRLLDGRSSTSWCAASGCPTSTI